MLGKVRLGRASVAKMHARLRAAADKVEAEEAAGEGGGAEKDGAAMTDSLQHQVAAGISVLERTSQSIQR